MLHLVWAAGPLRIAWQNLLIIDTLSGICNNKKIRRPSLLSIPMRSARATRKQVLGRTPKLQTMASAAEIDAVMANLDSDFKAWASALFGCDEWPRSLYLEAYDEVHGRCKRYGIDGMGDKPAEMSTTLYWLQHVPENSHFYGRLRNHAASPEHSLTEPKPKRARKGSSAPAAPAAAAEPKAEPVAAPKPKMPRKGSGAWKAAMAAAAAADAVDE